MVGDLPPEHAFAGYRGIDEDALLAVVHAQREPSGALLQYLHAKQAAREFLEEGAGLFLFRGIPVERYSKEDLRFMYWCIGRHLGTAVSQSNNGDALGDVCDSLDPKTAA